MWNGIGAAVAMKVAGAGTNDGTAEERAARLRAVLPTEDVPRAAGAAARIVRAPLRMADEPPRRKDEGDGKSGTATLTRPKTKKPSMYKVLMLNDDYTPMEFVVHVLERFFNKNREEATRIMLHVHQRGVGVCGVYTYEVAETKVQQTMDLARKNQHPLQCTLEKE